VIRLFDLLFASVALLLLSPIMLTIALFITIESKGGPFYTQKRIGRKGYPFHLYKFRTMEKESDKKGALTIGRDKRITKIGQTLRKYKLDELPQLFNVLKGEMSMVGPRPEVEKYVHQYNDEQRKILEIKPGITDVASIYYYNESELLGQAENPELLYIKKILPHKIKMNEAYLNKPNLHNYFQIILQTINQLLKQTPSCRK